MDAVGGLLISWLVIRAGWANTKTSLVELADAGIDDEIKTKVHSAAAKAIEALELESPSWRGRAIEVRKVQGIKAGQSYMLELELMVPQEWSIKQTRVVEDAVRARVGAKVRGARRVRVRFVPKEEDFVGEFISPSVSARSSVEPEEHEHDHSHTNGHSHGPELSNGNTVTKRK